MAGAWYVVKGHFARCSYSCNQLMVGWHSRIKLQLGERIKIGVSLVYMMKLIGGVAEVGLSCNID